MDSLSLPGIIPEVSEQIFGHRGGLIKQAWSFSEYEPSINRYSQGGHFETHHDGYGLTAIIALSPPEAYQAGGTRFFQQTPETSAVDQRTDQEGQGRQLLPLATVVECRPPRGMALVFNGEIRHAGIPVVGSGLRHIYVASFDVE